MTHPEAEVEIKLIPGAVKGAMKAAGATSRDLWFVPIGSLRIIPGFNVRVRDQSYLDHIESLTQSMLEEGYYADKPLSGYVGRLGEENVVFVPDGHSRLEAAGNANQRGANIERIPVVVTHSSITIEDLTVSLVRSNDGRQLTPYEKSIVCKRLQRFNWSDEQIAKRLGLSQPYVHDLLLLAGSPFELREMVIQGLVSPTMAIETIKSKGPDALDELQRCLSAAEAEGVTRVTKKHSPEATLKKVLTKSAPKLVEILEQIYTGPLREKLPEDLRVRIGELMGEISEARSNVS